MKSKNDSLNDVVGFNSTKVFVENGEVKTVLSEEIQRRGWVTVEELRSILHAEIEMIYKLP